MNVRRLPDALLSSPVAPVSAGRSEGASAGTAGASGERAATAAAVDRVDLSASAAAQPRAAASGSPEVERARVALHAGEGLSAERLHAMRERVRTGYYDQPAAMDRLAEAAARGLAGGLPDA